MLLENYYKQNTKLIVSNNAVDYEIYGLDYYPER